MVKLLLKGCKNIVNDFSEININYTDKEQGFYYFVILLLFVLNSWIFWICCSSFILLILNKISNSESSDNKTIADNRITNVDNNNVVNPTVISINPEVNI